MRRLGERGYVAVVDDLDVVVERKGASTVEALIAETTASAHVGGMASAEDDESGPDDGTQLSPQAPRLLGFMVNGAILVAVVLLLGLGAVAIGAQAVLGVSVAFVAFTAYDFVTTSRTGQTLGKRLARTMVVDQATRGPLRPSQAMLRSGIHILPLALLGTLGVLLFHRRAHAHPADPGATGPARHAGPDLVLDVKQQT